MIQDIYPDRLDNSYKPVKARDTDYLLLFDDEGRIFTGVGNGRISLTPAADFFGTDNTAEDAVYLFSIEEKRFFLALRGCDIKKDGFSYHTIYELFPFGDGWEIYAVFTAYHLWKWYSDNRYCGKCGTLMSFAENERAMKCKSCGNVVYPRINPAVIVGVINGETILLTKYRTGYGHNALIAGFTEIGETMEETVIREVFEETGLKVKNIRYYKSQPWGMAQDILMGFYCEADGDTGIHMDKKELKYAEWVAREDIVLQPNDLSLTNEMMRMFMEKGPDFCLTCGDDAHRE